MEKKTNLPVRLLLIGLLMVLVSLRLSGQVITNYSFTTSTGTFTPLSGATTQALTAGTTDNGNFNALPIGFDFWYMGVHYTTVSASTNGWLALGSTITDDPVNGLSTRGTRPLIAPLWDDLNIVSANNLSYQTAGTAGSRTFTLQYLNTKWGSLAAGAVSSFQVHLFEATGKIEFVYRSEAAAANAPSATVGIAATATGSGNFLAVNNAGTSVSSTTEASVTTKPVSGKTYDFTPPVPSAPSGLVYSAVSGSSMTLGWTDNSSNEAGFVIYRSTDGVTYTFISQTAANVPSSVQSGLTASTTYYWKVYAVSEGGLSTALGGSHATGCAVSPAAPTVASPVSYCLNATAAQLTATGSNLIWGSGAAAGSIGGTTALTTPIYTDNGYNNRKTNFTTTGPNTTITTVDYYIPAYQSVTGIVLSIYNSAGTVIATATPNSTLNAAATTLKVTNTFNYNIVTAGNYSIGTSAGTGNIGYDNPTFPITEPTGTITLTGTSPAGYRCFTNIQFTANNGGVAPTPSTTTAGTTNYYVSQTVSGCLSPQATIAVIVTATPSATISYAAAPYCKSAGVQTVTLTGTAGGTYSAPAGLTINSSTGTITPSSSTAGTYTVTYTIAASGGCAVFTTTTPVTITAAPAATISYAGSPYCQATNTATPAFTGTAGGVYSSTTGLIINAATGLVNTGASTPGDYTVTYSIAAAGGCTLYTTTASIVINASPVISSLSLTNLIAYYPFLGNANDATGNDNGTFQGTPVAATDRYGIAGSAYLFNGTSDYVSTANKYTNPVEFTISIWFKTATVAGGKIMGFGVTQTGINYQFDRMIYMNNAGQLYFGIYSGGVLTVNSPLSYNDNKWHLVSATLSSTAGMVLYVDGVPVGSNPSGTAAENYSGYWRIGYGNLVGWPSAPTSQYFNAALDDASIFHRALSAAEIAVSYTSGEGAGNDGPVCTGSLLTLTAKTIAGATYAWTGPNGFTSSLVNPTLTYLAADSGVYRLLVTAGGCTSPAYTTVVSSTIAGQWTGAISTDWSNAGNWCSGILPTATTNVTISAGAAFMPSITTSVVCNDLTIGAGATLTTSLAGTLNISGTLTNTGTVINGGTTNFTGTTGQQTFSGVTTFYNLTVTNAAGLLLPLSITVNHTLTIAAGTLNSNNFNIALNGNWINNASATAFTGGTARVTFSGAAPQTIGGTFATTFYNMTISDTSSSTTLLANISVTGSLSVAAGIFDLGAFTANRAVVGGFLLVANNATLKIGGANTFPINYTTNTLSVASTVVYSGANQSVSSQTYGNLTISSSGGAAIKTMSASPLVVLGNFYTTLGAGTAVSFTAAAILTVNGNVTIGTATTFNGGSYTHSIGGNWSDSGTFNGNTGTIIFTGAGTTVGGSGAQNFNNLTVAASSVSFTNAAITLSGNLATTGSGSFNQASGGTLTMTGAGATIGGTGISLGNLTISGSVTAATTLTLTGNLSVSGSFAGSSGTLTMSGPSRTISGAGAIGFNILSATGTITSSANFSIASSLNVSGSFTATSGTATFTGASSISGIANLYNTTINGVSLQLTANSTLGIAGILTLAAGSLDVTSTIPNTVNFNGSGAQNINGITYNNLVLSNGNTKTALAAITINNNITIGSGTTFVPGTFTHTVYNDWINNGVFTAGSGTIQFFGTATTDIYGPTTFNILTIAGATQSTEIILHSNITAATINMTTGNMDTGPDTLTITTTRTGNGIIIGAIRRTHAFTTGIAYAFESPYNTITFAAVSGVSTVIVDVREGPIADFPSGAAISEEYDVTIPAGTYTATLRLDYQNDELNGNNESTLNLWQNTGSAWTVVGKTANDASLNYVEQSGITALNARWTLSSTTNVVQWNGSVSTDWNTAANWTVLQGGASTPPGATDIVDLGTTTFTYPPTISTAVTVKNIIFGSAQALALSLANGGSLVCGNIAGSWTANATHTINVNDRTLTINGNLILSDSTTGHAINLNIGTGTVNVAQSLTEAGGANITFTGAGALNISEDFNYVSGAFSAGAGTVVYNGIVNQDIGAVAYNNLTINKAAGLANISDPLSLTGNLSIAAGQLDNFSVTTIGGNMTLASGATFINYDTLHVKGNWINNGTYLVYGGSIYFDGIGAQSISPTTFNNLFINKPVGSTATLTGNLTLQGNVNVISGTLDLQTYSFSRTVLGGSIISGDSSTVLVGGYTPPFNFSTYSFAPSSNTIFTGTGAQVLFLPGAVFGNLGFRNTGAKSLNSPITVAGNLTIEGGSNFDAGSQTISLAGNWINNGTFTPSASTLLLTGVSKTITGTTSFNKVAISGSYTELANITYNDLLTITTTGLITSDTSILTTLNGDLLNMGSLIANGTTIFSGLRLQTLQLINATTFGRIITFNGSVSPVLNSTSAPQFAILNINNTGGVNPSVGWTVFGTFTIGAGASFNGGPSTHTILGTLTNNGTITSSGTLNFTPAAAASVNLGTNFTSTGRVVFGGAGAMTLSGTATAFNNVLISNTNAAGITPVSNWVLSNTFTVNNTAIFNAGTYTYSIGGNIANAGTINANTSTFVLNGALDQNITSGSAFNNLTINKPAGAANLLSDCKVNGALHFTAGKINTNSYQVAEPATGSVTGAAQTTGWVNGKINKYVATGAATQTFEVGDDASFTPVALAFSNVTSAGFFSAFTTPMDHPALTSSPINPLKSVNRYWTLADTGAVFNSYAATCNFMASDVDAGASTAAFGMGLYNGSSWIIPVVTARNATNTQATGITAVGDLAIGEICNAGTLISYAGSPYCSNSGPATATLTGTGGGIFASGAGLSIDPATGTVQTATSAAGNYGVSYTIAAAAGCPVYIATANIIVNAAASATISYTGSPYCSGNDSAYVTVIGTAGGKYRSAAGLVIDSTTGSISLNSSIGGAYTISYIMTGCAPSTATASVTITAPGTWTGAAGTDWNTPANWFCGALPVVTSNIIIKAGLTNYPTLSSGASPVNNLIIQSGASLTVRGGILQIAGSITNNGGLDATLGQVEMIGSSPQTIPAAAFTANSVKNLTINNAGGVTLQGTLRCTGILLAATGNLNTGGYLTLASDAAGTAAIDGSGAGEVLGNTIVQRYLVSDFGYKYITSPFQAATVNAFSASVNLSASFPAFYRFDESLASSGWVNYTTPSGPLNPLQGYIANLGSAGAATTINITGVVNNHTLSTPQLYNHNMTYTQGFNLVGNPYPSPVNWNSPAGWIKTNIDNALYYFNAGSTDPYTGVYSSYVNSISSDGTAGNTIPAMQGFLIHVSDGAYPVTGQLTINNTARVLNPSIIFYGVPILEAPTSLLRIRAGFSDLTTATDPIVIYFSNAAAGTANATGLVTAAGPFNKMLDALKLTNSDPAVPNLYAISPDAQNLSILALPLAFDSLVIPLGLSTKKEGWITFNARDMQDMSPDRPVYLWDAVAAVNHDLIKDPLYRLYLPAGKYNNRFFLNFGLKVKTPTDTIPTDPNPIDTIPLANFNVYSAGNTLYVLPHLAPGEKGNLRVLNMLGQVVYRREINANGTLPISLNLAPGVYIVQFSTPAATIVKKIFIANR